MQQLVAFRHPISILSGSRAYDFSLAISVRFSLHPPAKSGQNKSIDRLVARARAVGRFV